MNSLIKFLILFLVTCSTLQAQVEECESFDSPVIVSCFSYETPYGSLDAGVLGGKTRITYLNQTITGNASIKVMLPSGADRLPVLDSYGNVWGFTGDMIDLNETITLWVASTNVTLWGRVSKYPVLDLYFPNTPLDVTVECNNVPSLRGLVAFGVGDTGHSGGYYAPGSEQIIGDPTGDHTIIRTWEANSSCGGKETYQQVITVLACCRNNNDVVLSDTTRMGRLENTHDGWFNYFESSCETCANRSLFTVYAPSCGANVLTVRVTQKRGDFLYFKVMSPDELEILFVSDITRDTVSVGSTNELVQAYGPGVIYINSISTVVLNNFWSQFYCNDQNFGTVPVTQFRSNNFNEGEAALNVFPNPILSNFTASFNVKTEGMYEVKIMDSTGEMMYSQEEFFFPGSGTFNLNVARRSASAFLLVILRKDGELIATEKVVRAH